MKSRRQFLASVGSVVTLAGVSRARNAQVRPMLSFGLMADCQYVDAESRGTRFYRQSPRKLKEAVNELNRRELSFTYHLGDFIDRDFASFDDLQPIAAKLRSKLHHALGNHDFDVADEAKTEVLKRLGLERGYYSFRQSGVRFIVLDTTEVSTYRKPADSPASKAAAAELARLKKAGVPAAKPWNGRPGDVQVVWLEAELKAATLADETVIVAGHHPIMPVTGHSVWNPAALDEVLQRHPCAKVYLNGHNHAGHYANQRGLHYLTLDGMVETEKDNAFAFADLYRDRLEITGFGRQESHVLRFR